MNYLEWVGVAAHVVVAVAVVGYLALRFFATAMSDAS